MIGNPPFLGGVKISNLLGMPYFAFLTSTFLETGHLADLVAYFFRRAFELGRKGGSLGLIATNTISQGDTREAGLLWIVENGGEIYRAVKRLRWPGEATIVVSTVHIQKGVSFAGTKRLNDNVQSAITAFLLPSGGNRSPTKLTALAGLFTQGTNIRSPGFLFGNEDEPNTLVELNELEVNCPECMSKIFPYLGGEEINVSPRQEPRRYVINANEFETEEQLRQFPELHKIILEKVKSERDKLNDNPNNRKLKKKWWCYHAERRKFYQKIRVLSGVIVNSQVSPHLAFVRQPIGRIWGHTLNIFAFDTHSVFACMQTRAHEIWAVFFASTLEDRLRYTPSDCFQTFPFPESFAANDILETAGETYHEFRSQLTTARNEGLTKTYNRFHDRGQNASDVARLRTLHAEMDVAVLRAYGWDDLADRAAPEFIVQDADKGKTPKTRLDWPAEFKDEVLARLLALNAERAGAERAAGLIVEADQDDEEIDDEGDEA